MCKGIINFTYTENIFIEKINGRFRCIYRLLSHFVYIDPLTNAIKDVAVEGGWASVAQIGSYLSQTNADFDPRSYGYSKLSSMLKELKGVHCGYATGDRSQMYFRKTPWSDLVVAMREAHQNLQDDTFVFNIVHYLAQIGAEVMVWRNEGRWCAPAWTPPPGLG